jgi:NADH dehydrogenase FAD-containing subunit
MTLSRREFIKWASAGAGVATLAGCATGGSGSAGRVVVIGGGYGGATAAKFIKLWAPDIDVTLVEPNEYFVSCPISNLVLGGNAQMSQITFSYEGLRSRGIRVIRDTAIAIDAEKRQVSLAGGQTLPYDRVHV